jgi:hypothetical protein
MNAATLFLATISEDGWPALILWLVLAALLGVWPRKGRG